MKLLSLDPGKVTGWSTWTWTKLEPLRRDRFGVIPDGARGFIRWWRHERPVALPEDIVFERFFLGDDFVNDRTLQASLIEGALLALAPAGTSIHWRRRSDKRAVPDHVLKQHGLWATGAQVGWEDGRDVNDSSIHALSFAKSVEHEPTLRRYFG